MAKYTNEEIGNMVLVSYAATKYEAQEIAKYHKEETGKRCVVLNPSGTRARKNTYDQPWQVREKP